MTEYTPTTDDIVRALGNQYVPGLDDVFDDGWLDRWLSTYTAKVQADALREAAADVTGLLQHLAETGQPLRIRAVVELLQTLADSKHPITTNPEKADK